VNYITKTIGLEAEIGLAQVASPLAHSRRRGHICSVEAKRITMPWIAPSGFLTTFKHNPEHL
jgi:hypothetical protein